MNLFKTRTGILPLSLLVVSFGAAAVLKPWWDRIRRLASKDSVPVPVQATTPTSWPASHASTWTVGPQSTVPEITRTEIMSSATARSRSHSGLTATTGAVRASPGRPAAAV
jgi:hypothetical protein